MGRVWRREVVAIRCEVRSCPVSEPLSPPMSHDTTWHDHAQHLAQLVDRGWAVVLTSKFRTYCPEHASKAHECTCRTNPSRRHLCVVHTPEIAALVWDTDQVPAEVSLFLKVAS